jgi:predicted  nucleic acid-binding Zn-ribbon protein
MPTKAQLEEMLNKMALRMKNLREENANLKEEVADLQIDKAELKEEIRELQLDLQRHPPCPDPLTT